MMVMVWDTVWVTFWVMLWVFLFWPTPFFAVIGLFIPKSTDFLKFQIFAFPRFDLRKLVT